MECLLVGCPKPSNSWKGPEGSQWTAWGCSWVLWEKQRAHKQKGGTWKQYPKPSIISSWGRWGGRVCQRGKQTETESQEITGCLRPPGACTASVWVCMNKESVGKVCYRDKICNMSRCKWGIWLFMISLKCTFHTTWYCQVQDGKNLKIMLL